MEAAEATKFGTKVA